MSDVIVVEYTGKVDKLLSEVRKSEQAQLALEKSAKKTGTTITTESNKAAASVQKVNKNVTGLKDSFQTLTQNLPFAGAIQQATQLGSAFTGVTQTVGKTTGSINILKVAFASLGLGAILVAFGSLITYFKSTEAGGDRLAKIIRVLGAVFGEVVKGVSKLSGFLFDTVESFSDYIGGAEEATAITDDYKKSITQLAGEVADLQDRIEALTITIERQNDKLQTAIEINLKALRRQKTSLEESEKLITRIGGLEEQKLSNSNSLIKDKIDLERKDFILRVKNFSEDSKMLTDLQKVEQELLNKERSFREDIQLEAAQSRIAELSEIEKSNKEKIQLFDKFINDQITAEEILNKAQGTFTQDDAKRISDILKQKESASRESLVLDERLENFRTAAAEKERARQEKIKSESDKAFQDKVKRIDIEEKLAIGLAKIEGRDQGNLIAIEEEFNTKKLELFKQFGKEKTFEYQELLLNQKTLENEYTVFLQKEDDRRIADAKEIADKELKEKQAEIDREKALDDAETKRISAEMDSSIAEEIKKNKEKDDKIRANRIQAIQAGIDTAGQLLNGFNDLQLANVNADVSNQRAANDAKTQSLIANLEKQNEAGTLSDAQLAAKKASIQKQAAQKESKLKEKMWKAEQNAQLTRIAIDAAVGVAKAVATYLSNPLTAAGTPIVIASILSSAAIQAAFIKAQPVPKFEEGGKVVEGVLNGKSHKRGGILIEAEGGERIFSKGTTKKYEPLFKSIQDGNFEKYAYENIARPAMKREQERQRKKDGMAENMLKSMQLNGLDTSHLERLTKSNKKVLIGNYKEIAHEIASVIKPKSNKGL